LGFWKASSYYSITPVFHYSSLYFTQCSTSRITDQRGCLGGASGPRIQ
jgi:hypothetical protein